jgi:ribosomal protein S19
MVYNGMNYYPIEIKDSIIGESLGKFSVSRKNNTKKAKGKNKR